MNAPSEKRCPDCGDPVDECRKRSLARSVVRFSRPIAAAILEQAAPVGFALVMFTTDTDDEPTRVVQFSTFGAPFEDIAEAFENAARGLRAGTHELTRDPGTEPAEHVRSEGKAVH